MDGRIRAASRTASGGACLPRGNRHQAACEPPESPGAPGDRDQGLVGVSAGETDTRHAGAFPDDSCLSGTGQEALHAFRCDGEPGRSRVLPGKAGSSSGSGPGNSQSACRIRIGLGRPEGRRRIKRAGRAYRGGRSPISSAAIGSACVPCRPHVTSGRRGGGTRTNPARSGSSGDLPDAGGRRERDRTRGLWGGRPWSRHRRSWCRRWRRQCCWHWRCRYRRRRHRRRRDRKERTRKLRSARRRWSRARLTRWGGRNRGWRRCGKPPAQHPPSDRAGQDLS